MEPAVALFLERAGAVGGADAVAAICRRLDGLPLAIELAAARLRLLSPDALVERLDRALDLLTSGPRDRPVRQQTLRATIDWSHSLLTEAEQRLFRRLAVFAGGCTVADVEAVCSEPGEALLDELESLLDNALVHVDGGRVRMLQTIGEFAQERLDLADEADEIAARHAHRYAEVAREIRDGIEGADQVASVERGIEEESNLQTALETLLLRARAGDGEACEAGLRVTGDLWMYWHIRGKNVSAREHAQAFLMSGKDRAHSVGRAGALIAAGLASWITGQVGRGNEEWGEAYGIATEVGAGREQCLAAVCLVLGLLGLDTEAACAGRERALSTAAPSASTGRSGSD